MPVRLPYKGPDDQTPTGPHFRNAVRERFQAPPLERREGGKLSVTTEAERTALSTAQAGHRRRKTDAPLPDTDAPHRRSRSHAGAFGPGAPASGTGEAPAPEDISKP